MVKKVFAQTYLWVLLLLLYSPIVIIVIYSFTLIFLNHSTDVKEKLIHPYLLLVHQ